MTVADQLRTAVEARDHAAVTALFAEDIEFLSPVKFRPFEGKPLVSALFLVLLRTFEDFSYVGEYHGDGHVLEFRTRIGDKWVHGIDMLETNAEGLISKFTVMVRPLSATHALSEAVLAGLVADGVVPAQA